MADGRTELRSGSLAFGAYLLVFAALAAPWLGAATRAIPAYNTELAPLVDAKGLVWGLASVAHALGTAPADLFEANIFYPAPRQRTGGDHFLTSQIIAGPVYWITGNAAATVNALAFLSYPIAAWAFACLARQLGCSWGPAWVGGLVFALGPLRVPANLQIAQYLNLYLALVPLALERLWARPTWMRTAALAVVLAMAGGSSFYMAAMVALVAGLWTLLMLAGMRGRRAAFGWRALVAGALAVPVVLVLAWPYLSRGEATTLARQLQAADAGMNAHYLALLMDQPAMLGGLVPLALAALGLAAVRAPLPGVARAARFGCVLAVVAALLMLGPEHSLGGVTVPLPLALLAGTPLGFLRMPFRFVVVLGLGTALLAAAGLELVTRWTQPRHRLLLGAVTAAVLLTQGAALLRGTLLPLPPLTRDHAVYAAVGETVHARGGGALLELPVAQAGVPDVLAPDHMIASTVHWLPLVTGYTAYPPPHRMALYLAIARLPDRQALADVVDMTKVGFILLAPVERWEVAAVRERLLALSELEVVLERDGWVLCQVHLAPRNPALFARIAAGER